MSKEAKLAAFLKEVANWDWEAFCLAEQDPKYSSNEALIFALVRACVMEKTDAIKLALNRLDGKLKTPVRVEYPKIFIVYPRAKVLDNGEPVYSVDTPPETPSIGSGEIVEKLPEKQEELPLEELSLRQTLTKMADHPRQVPDAVIEFAMLTQQWLNGQAEEPPEKPMVKSVVAAHLLKLAQNRNTIALEEVFNQIDGKLVETIQILGDDMYITSYASIAPAGAYLNKDGILQLDATGAQETWAAKLEKTNG